MADEIEQWGKRIALTILVSVIGYFLIDTHRTLKDVSADTNEISLKLREMEVRQINLNEDMQDVKQDVKKNTQRIETLERINH